MEVREYGCLAGAISSLVVEAGHTKGFAGYRMYTAYKRAMPSSGCRGEFRETDSNTKFNVVGRTPVKAVYEASVPLVLKDVAGRDFACRSTWAAIHEDGPSDSPRSRDYVK